MPAETPLEHHLRHPRSFLDVADHESEARLVARAWCLECDYEVELADEDAERWAELGVPWRTGTE